jgi:hypothetical protein
VKATTQSLARFALSGTRLVLAKRSGPVGGPLHRASRSPWLAAPSGGLARWRRRAGTREPTPAKIAEPFALELADKHETAARVWARLGCPYEAALALADAREEESLRYALDQLNRLGARPAAAIVVQRLREQGLRSLPRGPRPRTRENPAGLTARELEVLALLATGLRNA